MTEYSVEPRIARELGKQERLLWSGRPKTGLRLNPSDALLIPFSLMWGGFAIFWEATVIRSNAPLLFVLWGVPFVLIGLYLIIGRFFADARRRSRTAYALTNQRVIIVTGLFRETVQSLPLRNLTETSLSEKEDGTGTISLGPGSISSWFSGSGWPMGRQQGPPTLEAIPQARSVHELLRQTQLTAG